MKKVTRRAVAARGTVGILRSTARPPATAASPTMIVGCFALVEPFSSMQRQFQALRELGIRYADLTDNHNGGMLGVE